MKKNALSSRDILYEDNHLLVINKQAGWLSQGDNTKDPSVIDFAKAYLKEKYTKPGDVFLGLPHRLDRPVSGVLVLCKTSKALKRMNALIKDHKIEKTYHAVCLHKPKENSGEIISYIKKDSKLNRVKNSAVMFDGAKKSVLNYSCLKTSKSKLPILEIILKTGRPHQIRVQLNSIDCPILGDLKYYNQKPLPDKSIALHAHSLRFVHPVQQVSLHFIAPYPDKSWWK